MVNQRGVLDRELMPPLEKLEPLLDGGQVREGEKFLFNPETKGSQGLFSGIAGKRGSRSKELAQQSRGLSRVTHAFAAFFHEPQGQTGFLEGPLQEHGGCD